MAITIILPALNEEATVGAQTQATLAHPQLRALGLRQVIVVDNGSYDATAQVARKAGASTISQPQRGYGAACLAGALAAAEGDILLLMDADGSDDLDGAARVAACVALGRAELAVGSRVRGQMESGALTPQQRIGNFVAVSLMRLLYGARLSDLGPTRAIRREALLALEMREMTYGWSTEMLVKALRAGYRVVEEPVDYHRRAGGHSKVSGTLLGTVRAGWSILGTVARYAGWRLGTPPSQTSLVGSE